MKSARAMACRRGWSVCVIGAGFLLPALVGVCLADKPPGDLSEYVFRGDSRDPREIKAAGGFLPHSDTNYNDPSAYSLVGHTHARGGPAAYFATSRSFGQAMGNFAGPGHYVYCVHITPNMINVNEALTAPPYRGQEEYSALGGIPWSAVQGWLYIPEDSDEFPSDEACLDDAVAYRLVSRYEDEFADLQQADVELRNAALRFMDRHGLAVGWTRGQGFPLWQPVPGSPSASPPRCPADYGDASESPEEAPWRMGINITKDELQYLKDNRFEPLNCTEVLAAVRAWAALASGSTMHHWGRRGQPPGLESAKTGRRGGRRGTTSDEDCRRARSMAKNWPEHGLLPCRRIERLEFGLILSEDYGSGTYDRLGAIVTGPAGEARLELAEAPSRGFHTWVPVDMRAAFGRDTIDVRGITEIHLSAQGVFWKWDSLRNDQWQVQDVLLRARCADTGRMVEDDDLVSLKAWYGHPGGWFLKPFEETNVAEFDVDPENRQLLDG